MNEPVLGKKEYLHGWGYKEITWSAFLKLLKAAQKAADTIGFPVFLVGSALHKRVPRDIDISIIVPLKEYEKLFGKIPNNKNDYGKYLGTVFNKSFTSIEDLHFCIDYDLDIKVCPDIWWPEKPKLQLAAPSKDGESNGKNI